MEKSAGNDKCDMSMGEFCSAAVWELVVPFELQLSIVY